MQIFFDCESHLHTATIYITQMNTEYYLKKLNYVPVQKENTLRTWGYGAMKPHLPTTSSDVFQLQFALGCL